MSIDFNKWKGTYGITILHMQIPHITSHNPLTQNIYHVTCLGFHPSHLNFRNRLLQHEVWKTWIYKENVIC